MSGFKWVSKFNIGDTVRLKNGDIYDRFFVIRVIFDEGGCASYSISNSNAEYQEVKEFELIKLIEGINHESNH